MGEGGGRRVTIHDAVRGYARAADAYERGRPEYPQEVVELVVRALALAPARKNLILMP